ncbi:MAG TPA: class I SAM-dependent methyltransferase, partial [Pirellulales bacterium]|nr:class I SAM-dependent methyltransferase [Pirellulales bacterium]
RGYTVRRVRGYAAIDQGRNQMATDALADGFEELLWIDSDVVFHPDDVEKLRAHGLPIVCGIYPKKGVRAISCHVMPGTARLVFGEGGGLVEVLYAATGFLLVERQVFLDMQQRLSLPLCNEKFGRPMLPFFLPLLHPEPTGHWYLAEDYAFSQRARDCGYEIWADTTIRLRHIGTYGFSWEDAGLQLQRFPTFHLQLDDSTRPPATIRDDARRTPPPAFGSSQQLVELARQHPWPDQRPNVPPNQHGWLDSSTKEVLASVLNDETRLVLELGAWLGQSTRFIADQAPAAVVITVDHWRGSPEHQHDPEVQPLLPALYETFLTNCWAYRDRIIPLRMMVSEALEEINRRGIKPQVVYLDAGHSYDSVKTDLSRVRLLFPDTIIVGDDWDRETVRRAAMDVVHEQGGVIGVHGTAWRFFDKKPNINQEPPSVLLQNDRFKVGLVD